MKIVADANIPYLHDYFAAEHELILKPGRSITASDLHDADCLLVRSITKVNAALLQNTKISFVGSVTAGADHLDIDWLNEAKIVWQVAHGFNAPPVADYVVSVIAALQQKKILLKKNLRAAVIGVGHVGRLVVKHLQLLGFETILCDPYRDDLSTTPLNQLAELDLITLHVPLEKNGLHPTYHFIDKNFLARQTKETVLINASRGAVINTEDLLSFGEHLHWCLDVWENEPHVNQTVLSRSLIATPHIAGYSVQGKMRGIAIIYEALRARNLIKSHSQSPITLPRYELQVDDALSSWQEVVLHIFNPLKLTKEMQQTLLQAPNADVLFDTMRNEFEERHELGFIKIHGNLRLSAQDKKILAGLGVYVAKKE